MGYRNTGAATAQAAPRFHNARESLPAVGRLERTRLEAPDGVGTVTTVHWPEVTELASAQVAAFFCRTVDGCR